MRKIIDNSRRVGVFSITSSIAQRANFAPYSSISPESATRTQSFSDINSTSILPPTIG